MLLIIIISYLMGWMIYIKSPLMGSLLLILISILMSVYMSLLSSKWMMYLIILLFLGGMMVLFVYICSLISSMKIIKGSLLTETSLTILMMLLWITMTFNTQDLKYPMKNLYLSIMYSMSSSTLMLLVIIYLLMVLVTSIKLSQKFKGGLKSKTYDI